MKRLGDITDSEFDKLVNESNLPVVVDFWADWCLPCHQVSPIVEDIANDYSGQIQVFKMNIDENPETPKRFGIMSIPTLLLLEGGEEKTRIVGVKTKEEITELLFG